jgi:hypothetical protein
LSIALVGCGGNGKDDDTAPDASCDDIVTERLGSVSVEEWPAGLAEVIPTYDGLGGRWTATATSDSADSTLCNGTLALKFTNHSREDLQVVREGWTSTTLTCGCLTDPQYPDDTSFDVLAIDDGFQFYVESFGDPALNGVTLTGSGKLFGAGAPMDFRACAVDDVDPVLQSAYDQVTTVLRVIDGVMTGTLVLVPTSGAVETCELTDFALVEPL